MSIRFSDWKKVPTLLMSLMFIFLSCSVCTAEIPANNDDPTIEMIDNELILGFTVEYNAIAEFPLHDFMNGNIDTKYYAYTNDCWTELIDATEESANCFSISINGRNKKETIQKMFSVFPTIITVLDKTLNMSEITKALDSIKKSKYITTITIGSNIEVTYVPSVELSYGPSQARIDIYCKNYTPIIDLE